MYFRIGRVALEATTTAKAVLIYNYTTASRARPIDRV
jgi:hypothetical protein